MDYVKPASVVETMLQAGLSKSQLSTKDLLIRGALSGAILGVATSLALTAGVETKLSLIGALVFPVGFVMIVLLGLELVTGSFALVPLARLEGRISSGRMLSNLGIVFIGNLLGSLLYAGLLWIALTMAGNIEPSGVAEKIRAVAEAKTIGYASYGTAGLLTLFTKAILCNWMVCMGVVMAMTSTSTIAKMMAAWLPIFIFFAQGFEHSVVNMFVIPAGILLGANVSVADWWLWNQIPVTIGNVVGGLVLTGLALYLTHRPAAVPVHVNGVRPTVETEAAPAVVLSR